MNKPKIKHIESLVLNAKYGKFEIHRQDNGAYCFSLEDTSCGLDEEGDFPSVAIGGLSDEHLEALVVMIKAALKE